MSKTLYIINPTSNGGAGLITWEKFKALWNTDIEEESIKFTQRPFHATEIASNAIGYSTIVSVGGDGTVNEVLQGVIQNKTNPALAIIPSGTGNDIARNVGIHSLSDAVHALKKNHFRKFDILETAYANTLRYSFLTANFGFSANHRTKPWMKRFLGSAGAYYLATILEILFFRPWNMNIQWDNESYSGKITIVLVTNVERSSGGSMVIGPGASPVDGKITVTIVPFKSKFDCLFKKFPKTPTGKIIEEDDVLYFQTSEISVQSKPQSDMDLDGDLYGNTPAQVKINPLAIKIMSPNI